MKKVLQIMGVGAAILSVVLVVAKLIATKVANKNNDWE